MATITDYLNEIQTASDKHWAKCGYNMEKKPKYTVKEGQKFFKIIETDGYNGGESVHCFVDKEGNIFKAASWNKPARGIRGNINNEKKPLLCGDYYWRR